MVNKYESGVSHSYRVRSEFDYAGVTKKINRNHKYGKTNCVMKFLFKVLLREKCNGLLRAAINVVSIQAPGYQVLSV